MSISKKIVLIGTHPPVVGGISSHLNSLRKRLIEDGFNVAIVELINEDISKFGNEKLNIYKGTNPVFLLYSLFILIRNGFKLFHFHSSKRALPFFLVLPFLKLLNKKVILSIHHGGFCGWLEESEIRKKIYSLYFSFSDKIIFMNEKEANKFVDLSRSNHSKVKSISPFIADNKKLYDLNYVAPNLNEEVFKITTIGLWRRLYKYEDVLKACREISQKKTIPIKLDIVTGSKPAGETYKAEIYEMASRIKSDFIEVTFIEDKHGILEYLKGKDVLIRANMIDSYGLCTAEALLVGTPAIATNVCRRPENTLLYTPGNIDQLVDHLVNVYERNRNKTHKKSLLNREEDAYFQLIEMYESVFNNYQN